METWALKVRDDSLYVRCDDRNEHEKCAVAAIIGGQTGGHIPNNLSKIFKLFLFFPNGVIKCKVVGNV